MKMTKQERNAVILFLFIYGLIGYVTFNNILVTVIFSLFFTWITHTIFCRIVYGGELGFKLAPFGCHIFDKNNNLIASFAGDDWYAIENPQSIMSKRKITIIKDGQKKDQIVDYFEKYLEFLTLFVKSKFIPELTEEKAKNSNPNAVLVTIEKKVEESIRRTYDSLDLYYAFSTLESKYKELFARIMSAMIKSILMTGEPLKVYKIVSLSNGVLIYWIAHGEPAEYYTFKKRQYFRKWRSWLPWQKGMGITEMWGVEIERIHEIRGVPLRTLMCLPIQDESYRQYKNFVLQKYEVIFSSLSKYIEEILPLLPYFEELELKLTELKSLQAQLDVLKEGFPDLLKSVTEMSLIARKAMIIASKFAESMPTISEETRQQLKELGILTKELEEKRGIATRVAEKIQALIKEKPEVPVEEKKEEIKEEVGESSIE